MNTSTFPIVPTSDNVVIKITSRISVLQTQKQHPLKDAKVIATEVVAIGENVNTIKVGDNVITNNISYRFISIKDNDKSVSTILANKSSIVANASLQRIAIEYAIISALDIIAIDNQPIESQEDAANINLV